MQIACPQCEAQYNVDEARIPPQGVQIRCPRCQHNFVVQAAPGGGLTTGGAVPLPGAGGGGAVPLPGASSSKSGAVPLPGAAKQSAGAVPLPGAGKAGPGAVPLPGGGGAVPLPGAGPGAVPLPGGKAAAVPLPGAGPGAVPLPGAGPGAVPLPGGKAAAVPLPGGGPGAVPLPGGKPGAVPLPGGATGAVPLPGTGGPGAVPLPGTAKGGLPSMEEIFGGGAPASSSMGGGGQPAQAPGKSMSLGDIFGDAGAGGGKDDSNRSPHPFHGNNSVVVDAQTVGGDVLDFIDHAGKPTAAPKEESFSIRKRSGRVLGPLSTSQVLTMFHKGELLGSEEASSDGVTWRPLAQIPAFAATIQQAMANALSGLDDLPAPKHPGDRDLPVPRDGNADLPMPRDGIDLPTPRDPHAGSDLPVPHGGRRGFGGPQTDPGLAVDTAQLRDAEMAKDAVARKRRRDTGSKMFPVLAAGIVLAVIVAAGVAVNFVTPYGYFGYKMVFPDKPIEPPVKLPPVDTAPPPVTLSAVDQDYDELLRQDAYLSYRQGAEQAARAVDAGKQVTPFPESAKRAAAQQVRFTSYLVHVEELPVFLTNLREALGYADGDDVAKAIGEAASAYADRQWDKGITVLKPLTEAARQLPPAQKAEAWVWTGIGLRGKGDLAAAVTAFDSALQATTRHKLALYMQAKTLSESGEPESAREYLDKVLALAPEHPKANILLGQLLSGRSETLEDGKKLLAEMSEGKKGEAASPPQRAQAFMGRAEIAVAARQNAEALRYVQKAVELVPLNRSVRIAAAEMALKLRDYPVAKANGEKLLEMNPEDVDGLVMKARAAMGGRDALSAYSDLQVAAKKHPDSAMLNYWFGVAAREMSKLDEARAQFEKSAKADPKKADPVVEIVYDLIENGKLTEAVKRATTAEETVNPGERFKIRAAKAYAYARRRQFVQAAKEYKKALDENPKDTDTRARYATMLVVQRHLDEADKEVNEAQLMDAKNPAVIVAGGDVLAQRGDYKGALQRYEEAMLLAPNAYLPYLHAARVAVELKDNTRAKGFVETAGSLRPNVAEVLAVQAIVGKSSDPKTASRTMQQAIDQAPEEPLYPYELGVIYAGMGAPVEAIDAFKKAVGLDPDFVDAYYQLAKVQRDLARPREAMEALDNAVRIDPKRADAWLEIADLRQQQGDDAGALKAYEKALKADPKNVASVCNMGQTLIERMGNDEKNLKRGIEVLESCVRLAPKHPQAWKHLGYAYKQGGKKKKEAIRAFKAHIAANPDPEGIDPESLIIRDLIKELEGK